MADGIDANKRYSDADLSKWAGYEGSSTVRVMNEIRKDAGYHDYVEFGSDDVTASATKREQEELSPQNLALHGTPGVLHIVAMAGEEATVGAGMIGAAFAVELFATGKEIIAGDELRAAVDRDQMHMAMLANLDLPQGYKNEEMSKLTSKYTDGWKAGAQKMGELGDAGQKQDGAGADSRGSRRERGAPHVRRGPFACGLRVDQPRSRAALRDGSSVQARLRCDRVGEAAWGR